MVQLLWCTRWRKSTDVGELMVRATIGVEKQNRFWHVSSSTVGSNLVMWHVGIEASSISSFKPMCLNFLSTFFSISLLLQQLLVILLQSPHLFTDYILLFLKNSIVLYSPSGPLNFKCICYWHDYMHLNVDSHILWCKDIGHHSNISCNYHVHLSMHLWYVCLLNRHIIILCTNMSAS